MENIIIIAILVLVLLNGIRSTLNHFKGKGGCCGGGSTPTKRKKLKNVIAKKTVVIEGMSCEHCKNRVESYISKIDGAAGKVNFKKNEVVISMEKMVSNSQIKEVIEKAGYKVIKIKNN